MGRSIILAILLIGFGAYDLLAIDPFYDLQDRTISLLFFIPIFLFGVLLVFYSRSKITPKVEKQLGFVSITPNRPQRFFPLNDQIQNMESVVKSLADPNTNVYSNLTKITLSIKDTSVFLEEKNYKISILVNRRRTRRCFLYHGDILDMGELTLMFTSSEEKPAKFEGRHSSANHLIPRARKSQGKLIKNSPSLIPADNRKKTYYLTKNITFIGRSEMNDLTTKAKAVSMRHSKIERVSGRYKLIDMSSTSGTFINGRRVNSKFLKDGDVIAFETVKYTFSSQGRSR